MNSVFRFLFNSLLRDKFFLSHLFISLILVQIYHGFADVQIVKKHHSPVYLAKVCSARDSCTDLLGGIVETNELLWYTELSKTKWITADKYSED